MTKTDENEAFHFEGEEAGAGYASPILDLVATAFLVLISVIVMVASFMLPVPGDVQTAPGLLPFLAAASLLVMALGLGFSAMTRQRAGVRGGFLDGRDRETDRGTLLLMVVVGIYIAALQFLAFRYDIVIAGFRYTIAAFEPVTIIALSVIIYGSWRGPLWIVLTISVAWTLVLSLVFQKAFNIPLPGSF